MASRPANTPVPSPLRSSFAQLRRQMTTTQTEMAASPAEGDAEALRFALALRGRCDAGWMLRQTNASADPSAVLDAVAADCETGQGEERRWVLRESVRRRVLQAKDTSAIAGALSSLPPEDSDEVTLALRRLYLAPVPTLELASLPAAELRLLIAATGWTGPRAPFPYDVNELQRLLAKQTRTEEYARIVAGGVYGRTREIERVVSFLTSPIATPMAFAPRYLHAFGPGGIGKSTLIATAALAVLQADSKAALVHLDFDRADLDPARTSTLDLELLQQAGLSSAALDRTLQERRDRLREQLADESSSADGVMRQVANVEAATALSKSVLVQALAPLAVSSQPLLIILDTFEQVEAGGVQSIAAMRTWLDEVAGLSGVPEVRVLVSGRTNPREGAFADAKDDDLLAVGELDATGARDLLAARDVLPAVATQIFETFGGNPLVLRLAADLIVHVSASEIDRIAQEARDGRMPREMVQGLLYDRFLKHIDPPADAYAHPGLVLPEITVDLIREVLGPAQGLAPDDVPAQAIYDALKRAVWLIRESPDARALMQRRDLRQLMLRLMSSDPSRAESVTRVREAAITYHGRFPEPAHRAFVLYHQLMTARDRGDLARFDGVDFGGVAALLRPHLDDLPEAARAYAQARLLRSLGAEEALASLPDDAWTRYLAGDGSEAGAGDRMVEGADPMLALKLWRRRPVRVEGELPLFVLQAIAETAEWEDPAAEGALKILGTLGRDPQSTKRLYWLTRLQLLRGKRLSDVHLDRLSRIFGGDTPEYIALTSVAEAFMRREVVPGQLLTDGQFSSETRLYLVHATRFHRTPVFEPHLDALIVLQKDWAARVKAIYLSPVERWVERLRGLLFRWFGAAFAGTSDVGHYRLLETTQAILNQLDGAALDLVGRALRDLRVRVRVDLSARSATAKTLVLRGLTPEFYRPVRAALCEALTTEPVVQRFMQRLRPALTICPSDLEPTAFVPRAMSDPTTWFLSLVQSVDRARVMETMLEAALAEAPDHAKLRRVHKAWVTWDRALTNGQTSDWLLSKAAPAPTSDDTQTAGSPDPAD